MSFEYKIVLSFDLGSVVNEVGEIEKSLNDSLTKWGIDEKLSIRSKVSLFTLRCDREITKKEKDTLKVLIEKQAASYFGNVKVESIRRQTRKSCIRKSL